MNKLYTLLLGLAVLFLWHPRAEAQVDRLSGEDSTKIEEAVQACFSDYMETMIYLANPTMDNAYREAVVADGKKSFVDSALIAVDYDSSFTPPLLPNHKDVETYLTNFNVFFKEKSLSERIKIYYTNQVLSEVKWNEEGKYYYLTLHYTSRYGNQLPQKRRATFMVGKVEGNWKAFITYIRFEGADREEEIFGEKKILTEPEWRILARKAEDSLNNQHFQSALTLLQQSLALDTTAYNLKLLARYYQEQGAIEQALQYYLASLNEGVAADPTYKDSVTRLAIEELKVELAAQQEAAERKAQEEQAKADTLEQEKPIETPPLAQEEKSTAPTEETAEETTSSLIDLQSLAKGGKRGKEYTLRWQLPEDNPVDVSLSRQGGDSILLKQDYFLDQLKWKIPFNTKPGLYEIILLDEEMRTVVTRSAPFRIHRKFPIGLQISIYTVGAVYVAGALLKPVFDEDEAYKIDWDWFRKEPPCQDCKEEEPLDDPLNLEDFWQ